MNIPVFLSYPQPHLKKQEKFIEKVKKYLRSRGLEPITLGVTDYDMEAPLVGIRRLMSQSNGLLTIAFRRTLIKEGIYKPNADMNNIKERSIENEWLTSMYCHIEPAMAFQIGLPILIFRESGVIDDGILEKGVTGLYMPEFNLESTKEDKSIDDLIDEYFKKSEWNQVVAKWECCVRNVYYKRGLPPKME